MPLVSSPPICHPPGLCRWPPSLAGACAQIPATSLHLEWVPQTQVHKELVTFPQTYSWWPLPRLQPFPLTPRRGWMLCSSGQLTTVTGTSGKSLPFLPSLVSPSLSLQRIHIRHLLCARHHPKCLMRINSFHSHNSPIRDIYIPPFIKDKTRIKMINSPIP